MTGDARAGEKLYEQTWPEGDYRFVQLGFVVDDLYAAARRWATVHGVGPFHVLRRADSPCVYRGQNESVDMQVAVAQAGPVQIELIQVFSNGPSVFQGFENARAGFHQICTVTFDYDAMLAHYKALGYELVAELGRHQRVAFFDTVDDFGFYTEVTEASPAFLDALDDISRTCATWDGTDPVRILTRDGYDVP